MEIYITCLLQILCFSSRFRQFEMKNILHQPTMVADNITELSAPPAPLPPEFFSFLQACKERDIKGSCIKSNTGASMNVL